MSFLLLNPSSQKGREKLVRNAGGVLYLDARKATGGGIPVNSPLTSPWKDLSPYGNDATPRNMAGTPSSGVDVSDPLRPWWVLDGVDDYLNVVDKSVLDITIAPIAIFATIKTSDIIAGYIFSKNFDASTNEQFALALNSNNIVSCFINGGSRLNSPINTLNNNQIYNIGFIWDGTKIKFYKNLVKLLENNYSAILTNQPYVNIGCRRGVGETLGGVTKSKIASVTLYAGNRATEANILKAEREISKAYIGG